MDSKESALFKATALPAGLAAVILTGWLSWQNEVTVVHHAPRLALTVLFAVLSWCLSFRTAGRGRVSLEVAYFISAVLALPYPAPLVVAVLTGLAGSLIRIPRSLGGARVATLTAANVALSTAMVGAASLVRALLAPHLPAAEHAIVQPLVLATVSFAAMNVVNLVLMAAWVASRGESPQAWTRQFLLRILPVEAVTIPFGCLLMFVLDSPAGHLGFVLLAGLGLFMSYLLKNRSDADERLRRANVELAERVGELATLNAIGREISSSLDPSRVFEIVRRECRKAFRPDFFWVARINPETREVHVEYSMATEAPPRTLTFAMGQGLTSFIADTEKPLLIGDATRDPRIKTLRPIVVEPKVRSIVAVPLVVENRVVGVLSVQSFRENVYDDRHVSLLTTIGQQAAVALENARHYQMATVDQMTGLYQRDYFFQRLADEHRRASRYGTAFSLLMLDLDTFKRINDRFGHFAGDRLLRAVGKAVRACLRGADIPCRYGGEEFCILLPETDLAGARAIAERVRREIGSLRVAEGPHTLGTTVSIGVSSFPVHFEGSVSGLLQKADQALYIAKQQGKDRVVSAAA